MKKKLTVFSVLFIVFQYFSEAQEIQAVQPVIWHTDGSVTVNGTHRFMSSYDNGIRDNQYVFDPNFPVSSRSEAHGAILVDLPTYLGDRDVTEENDEAEYGIEATSTNGNSHVKLEVHKRTYGSDGLVGGWVWANVPPDDTNRRNISLIYGVEGTPSSSSRLLNDDWVAYGFSIHADGRHHHQIHSDQYNRLWSRPKDRTWDTSQWINLVTGIVVVAATVTATVFTLGATSELLFVEGSEIGYGLLAEGSEAGIEMADISVNIDAGVASEVENEAAQLLIRAGYSGENGLATASSADYQLGINSIINYGAPASKIGSYVLFGGFAARTMFESAVENNAVTIPAHGFTTNPRIPIPAKSHVYEDWERNGVPGPPDWKGDAEIESQRNNEISSYEALKSTERCPSDIAPAGVLCTVAPIIDVMAELAVTNATVTNVNIPGAVITKYRPYNLFGGNKSCPIYEFSDNSHILSVTKETIKVYHDEGHEPLFQDRQMILPKSQYVPNQNINVNLIVRRKNDVENAGVYYLLNDDLPESFADEHNTNVANMGYYGSINGVKYNLYKIKVITTDQGALLVPLELSPTGPFLVGDNIEMDFNTEGRFDQLLVGTPDDHMVAHTAATINGPVHVSDAVQVDDNGTVQSGDHPQAIRAEYTGSDHLLFTEHAIAAQELILAKPCNWNSRGCPDYVFSDDYNLKTLTEMERYVSKNKHLPAIPSALETHASNGYNLNKMVLGQLQNLEELTLHVIDQEKQLIKQQQMLNMRNQRLEKLEEALNQ